MTAGGFLINLRLCFVCMLHKRFGRIDENENPVYGYGKTEETTQRQTAAETAYILQL